MGIKAVCFDFGGVLVRTVDQSGRAAWENKLGLAPGALSDLVFGSDDAVQATVGSLPENAVWKNVSQVLHLGQDETDSLHRDFFSRDRLDQQLVDFLVSLRPRYKTAVLSNAWSNARVMFTAKFHLDQVVDRFVISAEEKVAKPDEAYYRRACSYLEVLPEEMVFVDDFEKNVQGALAIGIKAYLFKDPNLLISELKKVLY